MLVRPRNLGDWTLVRGEDGQLYKERWRRKTSGTTIAGVVLLSLSEVAMLSAGLSTGQPWAGLPVFGPITAAALSDGTGAKLGYGVTAGIQITSLVMTFVGIGLGEKYRQRVPVTLVPYVASTGGGAALSGSF